jgi:hypothetical protein
MTARKTLRDGRKLAAADPTDSKPTHVKWPDLFLRTRTRSATSAKRVGGKDATLICARPTV